MREMREMGIIEEGRELRYVGFLFNSEFMEGLLLG